MRVRFGRCLFDGDSRELRRDGALQALSPKAFQFLELLLSERPRALTKQEIHERLWPDSFVADSSLARLAAEVRSAMGDDAKAPLLLRTIHRFGYAFSGDAVADAAASGSAGPVPPRVGRAAHPARRGRESARPFARTPAS